MTDRAEVALSELMAARVGSVRPSDSSDEEFDLYSIPAFDRGASELTTGSAIGSSKHVVIPGDVLLSKSVPHIRRAWVVGPARGRRIIASDDWFVFRGEQFDSRYLTQALVGDPFHAQFMSTVAGVGGSLLRAGPAGERVVNVPQSFRTPARSRSAPRP